MPDEKKNNFIPENQKPEQTDGEWEHFDWQQGTASWAKIDPEPPAPQKPERSKPKKKRRFSTGESIMTAVIYVIGVLVISFVIATVGWSWANDFLALDKGSTTVSVTIEEGDSLNDVADELYENGLIQYRFLFKLFAGFTNKASKITTGTYELSTEMDYSALLTNISSTSSYRETVTVTIPEGYTVEEIFEFLEEQGVCSVENLTDAIEDVAEDYSFLSDNGRTGVEQLEGYLFPDTYEFYKGANAVSVLSRMLDNFTDQFDSQIQAEMQIQGYTMDEVIIIASIIEKETTGNDRNDISSVIQNRLTNTSNSETLGYLQMDSTVQYCLDERKEQLTTSDLEIDSPYNTYMYPGLPAGPICCPGLESIQAAVEPNDTDYYFFMLGDDGEDHFFTNLADFEAFKATQTGNTDDDEDTEE